MAQNDGAHILIVEDEPGFRLIYRGVLENAGFTVSEAVDGKAGLEMAKKTKPDLILLDLVLPELTGYEVLQKIRSDKTINKIPVIIFSVLGAEEDIKKGIELGANDYRIKGDSSPMTILEKVRQLLNLNDLSIDEPENTEKT